MISFAPLFMHYITPRTWHGYSQTYQLQEFRIVELSLISLLRRSISQCVPLIYYKIWILLLFIFKNSYTILWIYFRCNCIVLSLQCICSIWSDRHSVILWPTGQFESKNDRVYAWSRVALNYTRFDSMKLAQSGATYLTLRLNSSAVMGSLCCYGKTCGEELPSLRCVSSPSSNII